MWIKYNNELFNLNSFRNIFLAVNYRDIYLCIDHENDYILNFNTVVEAKRAYECILEAIEQNNRNIVDLE